jgi:hypothetical protein
MAFGINPTTTGKSSLWCIGKNYLVRYLTTDKIRV